MLNYAPKKVYIMLYRLLFLFYLLTLMKPASVEIQSVVKFHCTIIIAVIGNWLHDADVSWGSEVKLIAHAP